MGIEVTGLLGLLHLILVVSSFKVFTISCNLSILLRFLEGSA